MSKETIFKVGDEVYHYEYGRGFIAFIYTGLINVKFDSMSKTLNFTIKEAIKLLSFTPYDLVSGGFSQERPKIDPNPQVDHLQLVYVIGKYDDWIMRYATGKFRGNMIEVYVNQDNYGNTTAFKTYSLTNPLEK